MSETNAEKLKVLEQEIEGAGNELTSLKAEITSARQLLEETKNYINENLPAAKAAVEDIRANRESATTASADIKNLSTQAAEQVNELEQSADEILGESKDDGSREGGLRSQVTESIKGLQEQKDSQQEEYEALVEKIEGLLPRSATVGLAHAYAAQKDTYWWGEILWPFFFIVPIIFIVAVGLTSFTEVTNAATVEEATIKLLARLPFYLAAVWLAAFASKRQSQNKRLQQEYAHKETVSRSFEGYKREISELEDPSVLAEFIKRVIEMVGFNPSATLDGKHGDDSSPLHAFFGLAWGKKPEAEEK